MVSICKWIFLKAKYTSGSLMEQVLCVPYKTNSSPPLGLSSEVHPHRVAPNLAVSPSPTCSRLDWNSFIFPSWGRGVVEISLLEKSLDPATTCFGLTPSSGCSSSVSLPCPDNQCAKYFSLKTLFIIGKGKKTSWIF